ERVRGWLGRHRYRHVTVVTWDLGHTFRVAETARSPARRLVEYMPQRALVIGRRGGPQPTVLEEAIAAAERSYASPVSLQAPSLREGLLVALGRKVVLRVGLGPAARQAERGVNVLRDLR